MSTGADCRFVERKPGEWYYEIQCYPYGECEKYDTEGPFKTFGNALRHLRLHYANPGGYSRSSLPGCKHDLALTGSGTCDKCGERKP